MTLPLLALAVPEPVRCCGLRASGRRCGLALIREPWRSLGMGEDCAERAGLVVPRRGRVVEVADTEPNLLDLINNKGVIMTDIDLNAVLDLNIGPNDADADTVRGYLIELLLTVWRESEGFSGKRPFGNSSWEYELYTPLVKAGYVTGVLDEDGYLDTFDRAGADQLISAAIVALGGAR
jgi:hypothetical protein